MFRTRKAFGALFVALLLAGLQLHAVLHLVDHRHEGSGAEPVCAVCAESLQQTALAGPAAQAPASAPLGFLAAEAVHVQPRPSFLCLAPPFRGPPAVS